MGEDMPGCGDWMKNFLQAPCPVSSHCHTGSVLSDWPLRIQAVGHFGSPSRLEWPPKVLEGQQEELHQDLESFESSFNALERAQAVFHRNQSLWIKQLLEGHQEDSLEIQIRGFLQVFFLRLFPKVYAMLECFYGTLMLIDLTSPNWRSWQKSQLPTPQ